jgi:nucleotide-binding universal stress UspA family protein
VRVLFEHRRGDAARELLHSALDHQADLIVVGSSTHALHRIGGSLARRLVGCRRVPITVVP